MAKNMKDVKKDKWLELAQNAFRDSTTYLDNNYRTQWENNIRMFQNMHPLNSKYNKELYQRRSRIFRPKTRSAGQKFEAAISNAYFSTKDAVDITAERPALPEQEASASIMNNLLNYRLTKTIPWFKLITCAAQEAWKMGIVWSYQTWEYEEDDNGRVIKDGPSITLIPPENMRFDKSADWIDPVNNSPFIIRRIPMYVYQVKEKIEKDNSNKLSTSIKWNQISDSKIAEAVTSFYDSIRIARQKGKEDPKANNNAISDFDTVWIHENIIHSEGKDNVYYTLDTITRLSEVLPLYEVYPHGRPYIMGQCVLEAFKAIPVGVPELTQTIQEELNDVANQRLDNVKLVLNKRYFAKRGRNIDFRSMLRNVAGSITMMDNPLEDVQVINTPDITASSYAEQDRLNVDYDELAGNFSAGSVQTNRRMNETVGGLGIISSGAGQITEHYIKIFNETWVEPVLRQLIKLEQTYETDEKVLALAGKDEQVRLFQEFGVSSDIDTLLEQEMTLSVRAGIAATNPQSKVERFLFAMQSLGQVMASPVASTLQITEVVDEIFGLLGYKDATRFFKNMNGEQDPQVQQLMQQVQQMQAIIEQKQVEQQAKMQIEQAKLQLEAKKIELTQAKTVAEVEKIKAEIQNIIADSQKKIADTQRVASGIEDQLHAEELRIQATKANQDSQINLLTNKTQRDKIVTDLIKSREEIAGKLKITMANQQEPSKDILPQKKKESKKKERVLEE